MAPSEQKTKSFEETINELETIVGEIEQGDIPLEQCLEKYEKGIKLKKHCQKILEQAEKRIEKISKDDHPDSTDKTITPEEQ